ncbi:sulfatase-like hydrolase/transferase [uncultured Campylobacter sp.]|uniref:sulfatase-like hydrolase/transferase n=1 Tax=uncultured Campylobacter sp. TaxID=218934 RepID=UPI002616BC7B|nr:sulfatase-like hydrolase/transferase [uncultured Campylobacter sp.]
MDGFNSVGLNTIPSLSWALAYPDSSNGYKQNIANNIVTLSTLAGYETYWLSNQGFMGQNDTPITKMAKNANHLFFLKSVDYDSKNSFDFELLPKFKEFLTTKSDKNRVFFLHLIGSHPSFCNRIPRKLYVKNKGRKDINIYCYLKTIEQTDSFLKELYGILNKNYKDNNESFSMIYFSDHGLTHRVKKGELSLAINSSIAAKEHFAVPLIRLSSDDVGRKFVKNRSYGNYFAQSFAKWTGITTSNIKITNDIFEPIEQKDIIDIDKNFIKSKKPDSAKVIENFN